MCITQQVIYKCDHPGANHDVAILEFCDSVGEDFQVCDHAEIWGDEERFKAPGLCPKCQKSMEEGNVNPEYWVRELLHWGDPKTTATTRKLRRGQGAQTRGRSASC